MDSVSVTCMGGSRSFSDICVHVMKLEEILGISDFKIRTEFILPFRQFGIILRFPSAEIIEQGIWRVLLAIVDVT